MNYLTLKNDRKRRRRAKALTVLITVGLVVGTLYGLDATDEVLLFFRQFIGPDVPAAEATPVAAA